MKALITVELRERNVTGGKQSTCVGCEYDLLCHARDDGSMMISPVPDSCPLRNSPADPAVREAERILHAVLDNNGCDIGTIQNALAALKKARE